MKEMTSRVANELWNKYYLMGIDILYCENCGKIFTISSEESKRVRAKQFRYLKCCGNPHAMYLLGIFRPKKYPKKIYHFRDLLTEEGLVIYLLKILEPQGG